jgi:WD40 repeat protein
VRVVEDYTGLDFSPDGEFLVVRTRKNLLRLWDPIEGAPVGALIESPSSIADFGMGPDGSVIAVVTSDGLFGAWDVTAMTAPAREVPHRSTVRGLAFSPDARLIATAARDGTTRIWQADDLSPAAPPLLHRAPLFAVTFRPDGAQLATGGEDTTIRLWGLDGRLVAAGLPNPFWVRRLLYSPGGEFLLAGGIRGRARLWNGKRATPVGPLIEHPSHLPGHEAVWLAFGGGGRTAFVGSTDGTTTCWDTATGERRTEGDLGAIAASSSIEGLVGGNGGGRVATVRHDEVILWDTTGALARVTGRFPTRASSFMFSPDGARFLASGERGLTRLYSAVDGHGIGPPLAPESTSGGRRFCPTAGPSSWKSAPVFTSSTSRPAG